MLARQIQSYDFLSSVDFRSSQADVELLHSIAAADPLTVEFPLDVRCDPQFCSIPKTIHLAGEVFGELGRVDHQQSLVVGVGSRTLPVKEVFRPRRRS